MPRTSWSRIRLGLVNLDRVGWHLWREVAGRSRQEPGAVWVTADDDGNVEEFAKRLGGERQIRGATSEVDSCNARQRCVGSGDSSSDRGPVLGPNRCGDLRQDRLSDFHRAFGTLGFDTHAVAMGERAFRRGGLRHCEADGLETGGDRCVDRVATSGVVGNGAHVVAVDITDEDGCLHATGSQVTDDNVGADRQRICCQVELSSDGGWPVDDLGSSDSGVLRASAQFSAPLRATVCADDQDNTIDRTL